MTCLSFADNGDVFAAGSEEGNIIVWDCENDESLQKIESAHDSAVAHLDIQGTPHEKFHYVHTHEVANEEVPLLFPTTQVSCLFVLLTRVIMF